MSKENNVCGCCGGQCGGRHSKPTDPPWFGPNHWPTAMPHERADWSGSTKIPQRNKDKKEDTSEISPSTPTIKSSTGLVTLDDFLNEIKNLGVHNPTIVGKFENWFAKVERGECGAGMCRMQCNNLIKSAMKNRA